MFKKRIFFYHLGHGFKNNTNHVNFCDLVYCESERIQPVSEIVIALNVVKKNPGIYDHGQTYIYVYVCMYQVPVNFLKLSLN